MSMSQKRPDEKQVHALITAVGTNRDRLRQGIDGLRLIHNRWKNDNGSSINLIAQVTTLKSNLENMQDWLRHAGRDMHPQLLGDLDVLMASCALLARHLHTLVAQFKLPVHDGDDFALRLQCTVGSRSMDRLRKVAQRQNDAVTLLLAACKCHATAQRKILLHKSRQIRKEDASGIKTLARSFRWKSGCMRFLTQVSRTIQWFRFIFYLKLMQSGPGRSETPTGEEYENDAAIIRSEAIDRVLAADATSLKRETKIVLIGHRTSGKELIMQQIKVLYAEGYHTREERMMYRYAVCSAVRLLIHAIIGLLKDTGVRLPSELNQDFAVLLHEVETVDMRNISADAVQAVQNMWSCPEFSTLYVRNFEIDFPEHAPYFVHELSRLASMDYIPTEADIIRVNRSQGGIKELRFNWDELDIHLFNIRPHIPDHFRRRWFHQLDGATSLVYTLDVSLYDRPYLGQPTESQLLDEFATFESWASSPKFANSSVIILFNNFSRFCEKLEYSPLQTFFPDYTLSHEDPETSARQYILRRFKDVNHNKLSIYSFWVDLDMSDNQHLYAALKKTLRHVQHRRAKNEVWNASATTVNGASRSTLGLSTILDMKRSFSSSKKKASGSATDASSRTKNSV